MTAVARPVTTGRTAPAPLPAGPPRPAQAPRLAEGVELARRVPVTIGREHRYGSIVTGTPMSWGAVKVIT